MKETKPWQNASGANDPTAYEVIKNDEAYRQGQKTLKTITCMADLAGFEVLEIRIRNKRSRKVFKYESQY